MFNVHIAVFFDPAYVQTVTSIWLDQLLTLSLFALKFLTPIDKHYPRMGLDNESSQNHI